MLPLLLALSVGPSAVAACPDGMALVPERIAEDGATGFASFCLDLTEVTVAAYGLCVEAGECEPLAQTVAVPDLREGDGEIWSRSCNGHRDDRRDHPANCLSWVQAEVYCAAAGGRLPTEAEWEWAASGGDEDRHYPWGGQRPSPRRLNACGFECAERLRRLGRPRPPFDLAGNVWEFTSSLYADDPRVRVIRGGGWAQSRLMEAGAEE